MPRIIATLLLASIFITTVHSENILKCFMCTSVSNEGCGSNFTNWLQPVECTNKNIKKWIRSIEQHKILKEVAPFFEVDEISQHYQGQDMTCAKMNLYIEKQNVIVRACQTAKMELTDPCKTMDENLRTHLFGKVEECVLCPKDACNSTTFLSSKIYYIFLLFFCTFIFYHWL